MIKDWIETHKVYAPTNRVNIWLFQEYGFSITILPHWSIYILIGFVEINIFFERDGEKE